MAKASSQKFIARNRAPRVQIEYDVEIYGAQKKINLPFVMGVMADLSGNPKEALPGVDQRKFLEIDVDNFSPAAVARKVEPLRKLLEARTQLSNLLTYMDGKAKAEDLIAKALQDPTMLQALASTPKQEGN